MVETISINDLKTIIEIFEKDRGCKLNSYIDQKRLFIRGESNEAIAMLRFKTHMKSICIAQVEFVHQRKGYGSKLLEILKEFAVNNGYQRIEVESVLSNEMHQFVIKHGFKRRDNGTPEEFYGDWDLELV